MSSESHSTTVVLLGASNVALAWPRLMHQLGFRLPGPRTILTAHGMGRSYLNNRSSFAARQLPGILKCPLWETLARTDSADRPLALITDLGNDLIYGRTPQEVADSAAECVERIRDWNPATQFVVTRPPVASVRKVGRLRYRVFVSFIFPSCKMTHAAALAGTIELDERLQELSARLTVPLFTPDSDWFGWDPIHIGRRFQSAAFGQMMDLWQTDSSAVPKSGDRYPRPTAALRWVFGAEKRTQQPSVTSGDSAVHAF